MPLKNAGIFCYELSNSNAPNYCAIPYPTDREKKKKKATSCSFGEGSTMALRPEGHGDSQGGLLDDRSI